MRLMGKRRHLALLPGGNDSDLTWRRAAVWAHGQWVGPWAAGLPEVDCRRIEQLRDRIIEVGEERAANEWFGP
jgi:hypothetical protein